MNYDNSRRLILGVHTFSSTCSTMHLISERNHLSPRPPVWCTPAGSAAVVYAAINNDASWLACTRPQIGLFRTRRSGAGLAVATSVLDGD